MHKHVVNIDQIDWNSNEHGDFAYQDKWLAAAAGGEKLGASLYKLMPGKKSFPYHFHYANEEAVFILEGSGSLRLNEELIPVKKGDYIAFPVGPGNAHQIINTSDSPLLYLCFSTMIYPDVVEYPDSNKVGVSAGFTSDGSGENFQLRARFRKKDAVEYFEDET